MALEGSKIFSKKLNFFFVPFVFGFGLVKSILCFWLCYDKENEVNFFMGVTDWSLVTFEFSSKCVNWVFSVFFVGLKFCTYHNGILKPSIRNI